MYASRASDTALEHLDTAATPTPKASAQQRPSDQSAHWARLARAMYAADGDLAGWDSGDDGQEEESAEERFLREHPGVPVVERLQDLWKLGKVVQRRKKEEAGGRRGRGQDSSEGGGAGAGAGAGVVSAQEGAGREQGVGEEPGRQQDQDQEQGQQQGQLSEVCVPNRDSDVKGEQAGSSAVQVHHEKQDATSPAGMDVLEGTAAQQQPLLSMEPSLELWLQRGTRGHDQAAAPERDTLSLAVIAASTAALQGRTFSELMFELD